MATCFQSYDDPFTVQGRQGGKKSRLTAYVRRHDGKFVIRVDDALDAGMWVEVALNPDHPALANLHDGDTVDAKDFRYAD